MNDPAYINYFSNTSLSLSSFVYEGSNDTVVEPIGNQDNITFRTRTLINFTQYVQTVITNMNDHISNSYSQIGREQLGFLFVLIRLTKSDVGVCWGFKTDNER